MTSGKDWASGKEGTGNYFRALKKSSVLKVWFRCLPVLTQAGPHTLEHAQLSAQPRTCFPDGRRGRRLLPPRQTLAQGHCHFSPFISLLWEVCFGGWDLFSVWGGVFCFIDFYDPEGLNLNHITDWGSYNDTSLIRYLYDSQLYWVSYSLFR